MNTERKGRGNDQEYDSLKYQKTKLQIEQIIPVRPEIQWFAGEMEMRLKANDHKGGWKECSKEYLLYRLQEEMAELMSSLYKIKCDNCKLSRCAINCSQLNIVGEAADVANFAMMIADITRQR